MMIFYMKKCYKNLGYVLFVFFLSTSSVLSNKATIIDNDGFVTQQHALTCIQINKDMNLASQQLLSTEANKENIKSKINYLHNEIQKRRQLINRLDKQNNQSNNKNYNELIIQFENLVDERKQTISLYENENQLHVTQHESVIRLEQRFSNKCLNNLQITQEMHTQICKLQNIRWCSLFKF